MTMNKQKGNMYAFVTHTWNPIKGICSHNCKYCYMKVWPQKPLHFVKKELEDNLGENNFIFIGSSTDMFAENVPSEWITQVLDKCKQHDNTYLFQSKNPRRFSEFKSEFPENSVFGTTLESNKDFEPKLSDAPYNSIRAGCLAGFDAERKMVTIEPITEFNLKFFVELIKLVEPEWVTIGADSKEHDLPEPGKKEVLLLIDNLKQFTDVKIKDTLKRIIQ